MSDDPVRLGKRGRCWRYTGRDLLAAPELNASTPVPEGNSADKCPSKPEPRKGRKRASKVRR